MNAYEILALGGASAADQEGKGGGIDRDRVDGCRKVDASLPGTWPQAWPLKHCFRAPH